MTARPRQLRQCRAAAVALIMALATCAPYCLAPAAAQDDLGNREEQAVRAAIDRVAPSVVRIQTVGGAESVGGMLQGSGPSTGLIVSADGLIVSSAYNFARRPSAILVALGKNQNVPAKLIATDHSRSLVLLKVDLKPGDPPLVVPEAAPSDSPRPGAWAIAVGRTFGDEPNISVGIVSAVGRIWGKAVQTDAKISPANYGGPLVDIRGRVLGVLVPMSPMASGDTAGAEWYDSGIGFAVPLSDVQKSLERLAKGEDLHAGLLGVSMKGKDLFAVPPVIAACPPGGPAFEAGLRPGDRIVAVAGREVANQAQFKHQIGPLYAGDRVPLSVLRAGKRVDVTITLTDKLPPFEHAFLGILPMRDAEKDPGIVVRYVFPDSPAAKAGLKPGDRLVKIDGQDTADTAKAREVMTTLAPHQPITLGVERGNQKLELKATLTQLPSAIPAELPPARTAAKPAAGAAPPAAALTEIKVPEMKNDCFAYIPPQVEPAVPLGVLIWLPGPGKFDKDRALAQWKSACDEQGLVLLMPRPREGERWQSDEIDFIVRALGQLDKMTELDRARIFALGFQSGGGMALGLAVGRPGIVQGVAAVDTALPAAARPEPIDPMNRLAILLAHGPDGASAAALVPQLKRLKDLKYPVTEMKLDRAGQFLDDDERGLVLRWFDSLDRL